MASYVSIFYYYYHFFLRPPPPPPPSSFLSSSSPPLRIKPTRETLFLFWPTPFFQKKIINETHALLVHTTHSPQPSSPHFFFFLASSRFVFFLTAHKAARGRCSFPPNKSSKLRYDACTWWQILNYPTGNIHTYIHT